MSIESVEPIREKNNFDFVRLFAAALVVYYHAYALRGERDVLELLSGDQLHFGRVGVYVFFVMSGYLITQSILRSRTLKSFFTKRFLRIFPALIVFVFFAVFVIGPIFTSLSLPDYFSQKATYVYLLLATVFYPYSTGTLPGVFATHPVKGVCGSLWTITFELLCYFGTALFSILGILKRRHLFLLIYIASFLFWIIFRREIDTFPHTFIAFPHLFPLCLNFAGGMLLFLFRDKIEYRLWIVALLFLIAPVFFHFGYGDYYTVFALPYAVLGLVLKPIKHISSVGHWGDFSYGTYIYSFPVQQAIIHFAGVNINEWLMIALSLLFTIPFAAASWFLVEKRALKFKPKALI